MAALTVEDRFWSKVAFGDWQDCWLWQGTLNQQTGYGVESIRKNGRRTTTGPHRIAYELLVGPIPEGLVVDHVATWGCTSRACVNPLHLEAVTQQENLLRGSGTWASRNSAKTHCVNGHPFAGLTDKNGHRRCQLCTNRRSLAWYAKQREARREQA